MGRARGHHDIRWNGVGDDVHGPHGRAHDGRADDGRADDVRAHDVRADDVRAHDGRAVVEEGGSTKPSVRTSAPPAPPTLAAAPEPRTYSGRYTVTVESERV